MIVDAVILAGGRSRRLGGVPKSSLLIRGRTLLELTVAAVTSARSIVVVSDPERDRVPGVRTVTENPAFGGPVAGLAAGLAAVLEHERRPDWVLVLACDMPGVGDAVPRLLQAVDRDGAIAVDASGHDQYLAGVYRTDALLAAFGDRDPQGLSMRAVVGGLDLVRVATQTATDDIDTPDDADRFGAIPEGAAR